MFTNDVRPDILMTPQEVAIASERGRRMAAEAIRINPDSRRRMELKYGVEYCVQRYPEAYGRIR